MLGTAIVGGLIAGAGALGGAAIMSGASGRAAKASQEAAAQGVAEQRAAREELRKLLSPWVSGGNSALSRQMSMLGLGGEAQQRSAISAFEQSPMFQALAQQGETGILQNASATGGLRGGNVQGALAQFRPALLNQQLQQQFQNLGGISRMGQASAAGVGESGIQSASSIGNILTANAENQGNMALTQGTAWGKGIGGLASGLGGMFAGSGLAGGGGVTAPIFGSANIAMPNFNSLSNQVGAIGF